MCGIFGYIGSSKNAPDKVFAGLKDIEYRGYDSWGVAYVPIHREESSAYWKIEDAASGEPRLRRGRWQVEKRVGFLPSSFKFPASNISIGHTRWATHGGVTVANAHPHLSCDGKLVLVHNGIVENFLVLKKGLKNHQFKSETDTEVIVHLIEEELNGKSFKEAVKLAFKKLQGLSAIVVSDGEEIIGCRLGSPLVAGKTKDGFVLASDPNALLPLTSELIFLDESQMVVLGKKIELWDIARDKRIEPKITKVDWQHSQEDLKKYRYFLEKEIDEQPKVLHSIAKNSKEVEKVADLIKKAYGTFLIACGSASYACLLGVYLFSKIAKKHVNFSVGSEFNYIQDYLTDKSLLVAVSQSGESIDVLEPVGTAKKRGVKVVGLVNVLGSSLYRVSDYPVLLQAGMEKAVCSTKALTAMFAHMVLLAYSLIGQRKLAEKIILDSAKEIQSIIERKDAIKALVDKIYKEEHIFILGRGLSYPVALESTLKIKENAYIHAEGFAGGELKHGVIALIDKGTPVIVFVPNDETKEGILANAMEVKARGAYIIGVGFENNPVFDYFFEVKDAGASSVIPHPVFAQLLSYYLALKLGRNPDKPRNLAKSVTVK